MSNKIIIVNSDDWCGLYVNNQLVYQDNEIPSHIWWKVAQENPSVQYDDILDYYLDWGFLCKELGGIMPSDLNAIKNILEALENYGVDNWGGYEDACKSIQYEG